MLYSKLFDFVVQRVNQALKTTDSQGDSQMNVSVLDIFGFEIFPANFFEQFCINHANEKLQLHFNQFNFMQVRHPRQLPRPKIESAACSQV